MEQKAKHSRTAWYMVVAIIGQFFLFLGIGLVIIFFVRPIEAPLPFTLGLLLSCLFSILKVFLLERSIANAMDREEEAAKNYGQMQSLFRMGITIVSLLLAVFLPNIFGLFGTILGFLTLQFSAYIANMILKKKGYPEE